MFAAVGATITAVFANGSLDLAAARVFYSAQPQDHWPFARDMPWSLLYKMAPWITASLVMAGIAVLAVGFARRREQWRRDATFILFSLVLGPGLLVNGVFKDHWNRPRPRDVIELGGHWHYAPAPLRGEGANRSLAVTVRLASSTASDGGSGGASVRSSPPARSPPGLPSVLPWESAALRRADISSPTLCGRLS